MDEFLQVIDYLGKVSDYKTRSDEADANIANLLKKLKVHAVEQNDQATAKMVWCHEQILDIQHNYLSAFKKMKESLFYEAWCILERVEIGIIFLEPHFELDTKNDLFKLKYIEKHARQFQSLFPYKLFISPATLQLEKVCSICRKPVSIWNPCEHKKGEIYNGELCVYEVTRGELLELSVVPSPVQKYSVLFTTQSETGEHLDHYDYAIVKYAISGLENPFDDWEVRWTKIRHPHSLFTHVGRDENCPCESGKKYKNCCLRKKGVLRPHVEFRFSVSPPDNLPRITYPNYTRADS